MIRMAKKKQQLQRQTHANLRTVFDHFHQCFVRSTA